MKIAIIGAGISGLTAARLLHTEHEIHVFESSEQPGGHSNTVCFELDGQQYSIDTGFIVFNDRTYPNFIALLKTLGVEGLATTMSFAVRCDRTGTEYCGSNLNGLFAQRSNLCRPSFLKMVYDILRFNRLGTNDGHDSGEEMTVAEYLRWRGFGKEFAEHYLLPMGAAIWSCPTGTFQNFPIRFILEFYRNHGLLSLTNRPQWYTIPGGSRKYVERLCDPFKHRIHVRSPVLAVTRETKSVRIKTKDNEAEFDEVIFSCHSDQAMRMLTDATTLEREVLSSFLWEVNDTVLHTDTSVLPSRRNAWAAWNYRIHRNDVNRATVSYNMNILQHLKSSHTFCVTLNDSESIAPEKIISRHTYSHPVFTTARSKMQRRHGELIRNNRTSYCGAWWGNGFHEDGVTSAIAVCEKFGISRAFLNESAGPDAREGQTLKAESIAALVNEGAACE